MWDDEKIYNTARDVASRELRFIAIKEALLQMRNEDERELVECAKSNLATMARCGDLSRELEKAQRRIDAAKARIAELEAKLFEIGIAALDVAFLRKTVVTLESQHDVDMRLVEAKDDRIAELEAQLAAALATIERATWCEVCGSGESPCLCGRM